MKESKQKDTDTDTDQAIFFQEVKAREAEKKRKNLDKDWRDKIVSREAIIREERLKLEK